MRIANFFKTQCLAKSLMAAAAICAAPFILSSCGSGGGGDSQNLEDNPAPQTLDGIRIDLYPGGPILSFRRASGDATLVGGEEVGGFLMANTPGTLVIGSGVFDTGPFAQTAPITVVPTEAITGGSYTYKRVNDRLTEILISGSTDGSAPPLPRDFGNIGVFGSYTQGGNFTHLITVEWGAAGNEVTNITTSFTIQSTEEMVTLLPDNRGTDPTDDDSVFTVEPQVIGSILFTEPAATVQLQNGQGNLPLGYGVDDAILRDFEPLFPTVLDTTTDTSVLSLRPSTAVTDDDVITVTFIVSTYLPEVDGVAGQFLETGTVRQGGLQVGAALGSYRYTPTDPGVSDTRASLELSGSALVGGGAPGAITYTLSFLSFSQGTYVDSAGGTGAFDFIDRIAPSGL